MLFRPCRASRPPRAARPGPGHGPSGRLRDCAHATARTTRESADGATSPSAYRPVSSPGIRHPDRRAGRSPTRCRFPRTPRAAR
ncbi:hypothetical protein CAG99_01945 [Streptomyces marincola]|uniref:Uncharacterized protein n=1 Tax=Streptomyces marincola TaxID=2878388 RepID=A0A1W7CSS3_9ACTN|nr:hypothetical protein CAG99_01945 [Streptomyces marincola]